MPRLTAPFALIAALSLAAPAAMAQMTDAERSTLRTEIRAYLMDNPEVIFEAVAEFERRTAMAQTDMDTTLVEINADELFFDAHSWVGGNPEGDLTLVEFVDYRCSFCRQAFPEMMTFVAEDANVRLVIKELPILSPESELMSRFAISVLQLGDAERYLAAHEALIGWTDPVTEVTLGALATELGLDPGAVFARMRTSAVTTVLAENRSLAQRLQISGTPTFAMGTAAGGELVRGFRRADHLAGLAAQLRD